MLARAAQALTGRLHGPRGWGLGAAWAARALSCSATSTAGREGQQQSPVFWAAAAAGAALAGMGFVTGASCDAAGWADEHRRRVFYTWEKKLREHSTAEKVFQYFASIKPDDETLYMTPVDFMRAVIPVYPVDGVRNGSLPGENALNVSPMPKFMDTSVVHEFFRHMSGKFKGAEVMSYTEFLFLRTCVAIPERHLSAVFRQFDLDGNGTIDLDEFQRIVRVLRNHAGQASGTDGLRGRTGLVTKTDPPGHLTGLVAHLFGVTGTHHVKLSEFEKLVAALRECLVILEFEHYDPAATGSISGRSFALCVLSGAPTAAVPAYLARVDALPTSLAAARISFPEFNAYGRMRADLSALVGAISLAMDATGEDVSAASFQLAAERVCGAKLSDVQVAIIMAVFDSGGDGKVSLAEITGALNSREGSHPTRSSAMKDAFTCVAQCRG